MFAALSQGREGGERSKHSDIAEFGRYPPMATACMFESCDMLCCHDTMGTANYDERAGCRIVQIAAVVADTVLLRRESRQQAVEDDNSKINHVWMRLVSFLRRTVVVDSAWRNQPRK